MKRATYIPYAAPWPQRAKGISQLPVIYHELRPQSSGQVKYLRGYKHSDLSAASNYGETNASEKMHVLKSCVVYVISECVSRQCYVTDIFRLFSYPTFNVKYDRINLSI